MAVQECGATQGLGHTVISRVVCECHEALKCRPTLVAAPDIPVPFAPDTLTMPGHDWMIEDQRFAARRPDVLVYRTEPLYLLTQLIQ